MLLDQPLATVTPTVDGDVLTVLALATAAFTPPEVHRVVGRHSVSGVRKALNRLVSQGVVEVEPVGKAFRYQLNRDHLAASAIVDLANLRGTLIERIRGTVEGWRHPPLVVTLFGSAATGGMRVNSDIDVFIVGDGRSADNQLWRSQVTELELAIHRWTGNDARVLEYNVEDLDHDHDPVVDSIVRDGIHIVGDRTLLRRARRRTG